MKLAIFRTKPHRFTGCTPMTAAERMARYSEAHAQRMRERENQGAGIPRARLVDGRTVLVALDGKPNTIPKDATERAA